MLSKLQERFRKEWLFLLMMLPGLILTAIFSYGPMYGIIMAFQDYNPGLGYGGSPWVGMANFKLIFSQPAFLLTIRNTFFISFMKILFSTTASVVFALQLNEIRQNGPKRVFQTIVYIPNFISWVIMAGILTDLLGTNGIINEVVKGLGGKPVQFLSNRSVFPWTLIFTDMWKTFGFGTVVYLATMTSIDPEMYESAVIDGAGRWRQTWSITLPMLIPIIILMTVLALGNVLSAGFDQVYNLYSPSVFPTGDIIDTYVYRAGLQSGKYAIGTAVGLFKSLVSSVLISTSLFVAYKFAGYKVF